MKKEILLTACGILLWTANTWALTPDTIRVYNINGKDVPTFNGSQLAGKFVKTYTIGHKKSGKNVIETHTITLLSPEKSTVKSVQTKVITTCPDDRKTETTTLSNPTIFVNGKIHNKKLSDIPSDSIKEIKVYKGGTEEANKYGSLGKNGVVLITTKGGNSEEGTASARGPLKVTTTVNTTVYFIDGKESTAQEVKALSPSQIAKINVLKKGSKEAIQKSKKGESQNILLIETVK